MGVCQGVKNCLYLCIVKLNFYINHGYSTTNNRLDTHLKPGKEGFLDDLVRLIHGIDKNIIVDNMDLARHFANWQKERMLKDAMPCKLGWYDGFIPEFTEEQMADVADKLKLNVGDDIKVLIVK